MIRSEIVENEGPTRLVRPCHDIITAAREKLFSHGLFDRDGTRRAYIRSLVGVRNYAVSAYYPYLLEIGPDLTISGVQLSPDGFYLNDLISLTLPSDTRSATPNSLRAWGLESYTTQGLQRLADELLTGTQITRLDYYNLLPGVHRNIY